MARKTGPSYQMSHAHRDKIKNSNILNALLEHVDGKREMSSTQVTAGLGLLKKVMPDLQPIDPDTGEGGVTIRLPDRVRDIL